MRLILVRHPQPQIAPGICYGSTDLPALPEEIERVHAALMPTLPRDAALFSSPLRRCAKLATRLNWPTLTFDARLAEMDFGAWEMQPWDAIPRAQIDAWAADLTGYHPGGGESVLQMAARVADFYADLQRQPQQDAIVICHAGTMRLLSACHANLPLHDIALQAAQSPHKIGYGETIILRR